MTLRAASLDGTPAGAQPLSASDWPGVRRCFDALEAQRAVGLQTHAAVWDWMRRKSTAPGSNGDAARTTSRSSATGDRLRDRTARATRRTPSSFEDFGSTATKAARFCRRSCAPAAGDSTRVGGWLPPPIAREALPRGSVRARKDAITMVAPLSSLARAWYASFAATLEAGRADPFGRPTTSER
jgi:hypothetical protein